MAIEEITKPALGKSKSGWSWDKRRELWITWKVDTHFNGERHIRRGFATKADAEAYLDRLKFQEKLKEIGVIQLIKFPTVEQLLEKHLGSIESRSEQVRARRVYERFLKILHPGARLDEVRRKHFKDYSDARLGENVKADTVRREITPIVSAFNRAANYFSELENWKPPAAYRPAGENTERSRVIDRSEREKLIDHLLREKERSEREKDFTARRRTGLIFYFGLLTGLRHGEIAALEKINFSLSNRSLKVERFKTRKSGVRWTVFEPLTDTQVRILAEGEKLYPESRFFFSEHGRLHNKTYTILSTACKKFKIPYGRKTAGGLVIHDSRHTFVTTLEHGGVDSSTTRGFSGHSKETMMKRYAHATFDSRSRAMDIIEREMGDNKTLDAEKRLKEIFEAAAGGKIDFDQFKKMLEDSFTVF